MTRHKERGWSNSGKGRAGAKKKTLSRPDLLADVGKVVEKTRGPPDEVIEEGVRSLVLYWLNLPPKQID